MRLTDLLPLRSSAVWREFASVEPIPIRYGRTAGRCVPYSTDRATWVWADHPVQGIDTVTIDGAEVSNWEHRNGLDSTGRAVAFVEFADPVDGGVEPFAYGRGKTGSAGLLENPADVIADLCAIAGLAVPELDSLRAETASRSLRLAYSIRQRRSLQTELRDIAQSIGGIYSAGITGYVRLLPVAGSPLVSIGERYIGRCSTSLESLRTRIVCRYAYHDGDPTAGLESAILSADADSLAEHELPCVADGRTAADVVARHLARFGVPVWAVNVSDYPAILLPGDSVTISGRDLSGTGVVVGSQVDRVTGKSDATIELRTQTAGAVTLVRQGSAVAFDRAAGGTVTTVDGERVITLTWTDGAPMVGARVILGATTRFADGAGRVSFPADIMPRGTHDLLIYPPGADEGQGYAMTVVVP